MRLLPKLILWAVLLISSTVDAKNIEGIWYHDGQQTTIRSERPYQYVFCNEYNSCSRGYLTNDTIRAPQWGVDGHLRRHQQMIEWTNGTSWVRFQNSRYFRSPASNIAGTWYYNNQATTIQSQGNNNFLLINELGQLSRGIINNDKLIIPTANITGVIKQNGRMIVWSNQTIWKRYQTS